MKKQPKKLTLNKETLRDLTVRNAEGVKGGSKGMCTFYCIKTNATCNKGHTCFPCV